MTNNKVSLKDIYDVMNRLEDKLDKRMHDIECRVDVLEDFKGRALGVIAVISAFVGVLATWIWEKLTKS